MAKFTTIVGLIYENFDRTIHVTNIPIDVGSFGFSVDRGIENPSAVLFFYNYMKEGDLRIHVFDEIYQNGLTAHELTNLIKMKMGNRNFSFQTADPSAKDFIATANELGLSITPPSKEGGENWVLEGIGKVKHWLAKSPVDGKPRLTISPTCKNLIEELENYVWDENLDKGEGKDRPRKIFDHAVDSLRYYISVVSKTSQISTPEQVEEFLEELPVNNLFNDKGFY